MIIISNEPRINEISDDNKEKLLLVGDVICPTFFVKNEKELQRDGNKERNIEQLPIFPNLLNLSITDKFMFSINESVAAKLQKHKKNTYLAIGQLLAWGRKVKEKSNYTVVGLYENEQGKIYTQQLAFKKMAYGAPKVVGYSECETHVMQLNSHLSWSIGQIKESGAEHVYFAGNVSENYFDEYSNDEMIEYVKDEPFKMGSPTPLLLSKNSNKSPIVPILLSITCSLGIFMGTKYHMEERLNNKKAEYAQIFEGVKSVYSPDKSTSSIDLIQQRQFFLESYADKEPTAKYINQLIGAVGKARKNDNFKQLQLTELQFNKGANTSPHEFELRVSLYNPPREVEQNDLFKELIFQLGNSLNSEIYSLSRPRLVKIKSTTRIEFQLGGKFKSSGGENG